MRCASSGHWRSTALWVKKMVGRLNVSTMADEHLFLHSSEGDCMPVPVIILYLNIYGRETVVREGEILPDWRKAVYMQLQISYCHSEVPADVKMAHEA